MGKVFAHVASRNTIHPFCIFHPPCVSSRKFARKLFFSSCPVCPITNEEASFISSTETCLEGIARKGDRIFRFTLLSIKGWDSLGVLGGVLIFEWDRLEIFGLYDTFQVSSACSSMYSRLVTRWGGEFFTYPFFFVYYTCSLCWKINSKSDQLAYSRVRKRICNYH